MKAESKARVGKSIAREIALIGLSVAIITVCAWTTLPVLTVPFTLQTLGVALIGGVLGWKRSLAAVSVYILLGLVGVPVFSGFNAGVGALFGPTGGYIFGFFFLALAPALFKLIPVRNKWGRAGVFYAGSAIGMAVCYLFGSLWFSYLTECALAHAFVVCVVPYLLPDAVKFVVSSLLAVRLEKFVK